MIIHVGKSSWTWNNIKLLFFKKCFSFCSFSQMLIKCPIILSYLFSFTLYWVVCFQFAKLQFIVIKIIFSFSKLLAIATLINQFSSIPQYFSYSNSMLSIYLGRGSYQLVSNWWNLRYSSKTLFKCIPKVISPYSKLLKLR